MRRAARVQVVGAPQGLVDVNGSLHLADTVTSKCGFPLAYVRLQHDFVKFHLPSVM
jgi:hypothetical protein